MQSLGFVADNFLAVAKRNQEPLGAVTQRAIHLLTDTANRDDITGKTHGAGARDDLIPGKIVIT